ncbi:MAG: right-handed parallel beta-helix repeat-containing protein, partial [Thermoplasmata archaeon]|nr:right-handed parallel beta-helix repeat-containing protein [Thermoplasmata archaeon]
NQVQHAGTYAIDIENCTQVRLSGDNASGFHYTGLRVVSSTGVTSTGDVFDYGTYALSNGTLLRSSSAVTINSDSDQHDSVGILDLGSSSVRVESTNLSFDTNGGVFEGDANIVVTAGTAFADTNGLVFSDTLNGYAYTNNITGAANGIVAEQSPGIDLETNAFFNDGNGIVILTCQGPYVVDNSITDSVDGLVLEVSGEAIVRSNSIHHPTGAGLVTQQLSQSFVYQNNISNAATGFVLIQDVGMQLYLNSFFADTTAFVVSQGSGNTVYWNAFIADGPMSYDPSSPSNSTLFDSGYPAGGNYWSNWTTPDAAHGPGQNLAGSDGIVDHPLNITATGTVADHYPLTHILTQAGRTFQFHATGLTGGPLWGIHLLGGLYPYSVNTSGSSITYQSGYAANSSYSYTVYAPSGWIATPSSGAFLFDGTAQNITIAFSPVTYGVTFSESGLPTGTSWNVTVGGVSHGGSASSWVVPLANGTYNFTVGSSAGYTVTPRMGTFTVASAGTTVSVTFTPVVYAVTFTESGLPTGTSWSVVAGGATKTASSPSISFSLANGSYPFSVTNVTGYTTTPGSGVSLVSGGSANWNVVFLAHSSPSTSGSSTSSFTSQPLFWALLAAVIVLALLVALLALMGRRKKPSEVPPAASWSPPGAAGTAGTAAPATPAPGSGGSEPAWKET